MGLDSYFVPMREYEDFKKLNELSSIDGAEWGFWVDGIKQTSSEPNIYGQGVTIALVTVDRFQPGAIKFYELFPKALCVDEIKPKEDVLRLYKALDWTGSSAQYEARQKVVSLVVSD